MAPCKPIVEARPGRVETGGPSRDARNADPGGWAVGGPKKERQSGLGKVDGRMVRCIG